MASAYVPPGYTEELHRLAESVGVELPLLGQTFPDLELPERYSQTWPDTDPGRCHAAAGWRGGCRYPALWGGLCFAHDKGHQKLLNINEYPTRVVDDPANRQKPQRLYAWDGSGKRLDVHGYEDQLDTIYQRTEDFGARHAAVPESDGPGNGLPKYKEMYGNGDGPVTSDPKLTAVEADVAYMLATLTKRQREAVQLVRLDGVSLRAAAAELGTSPTAVAKRLAGADKRLQRVSKSKVA